MKELFVDEDITKARAISPAFYLDQAYFEASKEKIFRQNWLFAGVSKASSVRPVNVLPGFLDERVLITNGEASHCVSNVCTHRGKLICEEEAVGVDVLRCGYHGRKFALDGKFMSMPGFEDAVDFPEPADDLSKFGFERVAGLDFVNLDGDFEFPGEDLADQISRVAKGLSKAKITETAYTVNAHWALYCENYLEGFHIPFVHKSLNAAIDFSSYRTELFDRGCLQTAKPAEGEASFANGVAAYYYFLFPNLMFNFYPWGISFNSVEPVSRTETRVVYVTIVIDKEFVGEGAGNNLGMVELEDQAVVESVQKGIASKAYPGGRYSPRFETGTHHFHRLIAKAMNSID